jgi:hypothetical protein
MLRAATASLRSAGSTGRHTGEADTMLKWLSMLAILTPPAIFGALLAQSADTAAQGTQQGTQAGTPAAPASAAPAPFNPGIGDLMNLIVQPRHTKLWFAGRSGNWVLAEYEIKELRSALANVAKARPAFRNQAVGETIQTFMNGPFGAIEAAIRDRDGNKFAEAYAGVNGGCNACHSALNQPQVVIKIPELAAYPDQDFFPRN